MMNYKAVGFDYGGVIAKPRGRSFGLILAEFLKIPHDQVRDVYFRHNGPMNRDEFSYEECWRRVVHDLGYDTQMPKVMELLQESIQAGYDICSDVVSLSDTLRGQGLKTAILSNNSRHAAERMRAEGLGEHFDAVLVSAETGFVKPEAAAFHDLVKRLGITAKELVFIDDTDQSLISAPEIGYAPILFTLYNQLLLDLEKLGIGLG